MPDPQQYTDAQLSDGTTLRFIGQLGPDEVRQKVQGYRARNPQQSIPKPPLPGALNPNFDPNAPSREETGGTSPMDALKRFGMAAGGTAGRGVRGGRATRGPVPRARLQRQPHSQHPYRFWDVGRKPRFHLLKAVRRLVLP